VVILLTSLLTDMDINLVGTNVVFLISDSDSYSDSEINKSPF
jgi:hypothetical protein